MHPRRFEELVGAIFSDSGHRVRVTSYSCDNGIDSAVLEGPGDTLIGVQVKRYRNTIIAEQIRSFAGALVLGGITKGVLVTTSSCTTEASQLQIATVNDKSN
jgi:restriction system protein